MKRIAQFWVMPSIYRTKARGPRPPRPDIEAGFLQAALVLSGWPNKKRKELNNKKEDEAKDHEGQYNDEACVTLYLKNTSAYERGEAHKGKYGESSIVPVELMFDG